MQRHTPPSPAAWFSTTSHPYYIFAPGYRQNSAGIRCLHYLCHMLNETGHEAYIVPGETTNPYLRTPLLPQDIPRMHFETGRVPIAVYPEVISGNPLSLPVVARWLLNKPGVLGGDTKHDADELLFCFDPWTVPEGIHAETLRIPSVDTRIFNNFNNEFDHRRSGFCYYAHKFLIAGGKIDPELISNGISLGQEIPRSHEELAEILRKSEYLYCYEQSAIVQEALACGCPVIIKTSEYWSKTRWAGRFFGVAEDSDPEALAVIKDEAAQYQTALQKEQNECWPLFENFVEITQRAAKSASESVPPLTETNQQETTPARVWLLPPQQRKQSKNIFNKLIHPHLTSLTGPSHKTQVEEKTLLNTGELLSDWLEKRNKTNSDNQIQVTSLLQSDLHSSFHIIIRVTRSDTNLFANTIDSLAQQYLGNWHLDVISPLPVPDGLHDIPCIGWHQPTDDISEDKLIETLVRQRALDLIIELPAGAILDPQYLLRITHVAQTQPKKMAFFTDDMVSDEAGNCLEIRFKPGINIEHLRASDLAGPLCVRRETWLCDADQGAHSGSPWFGLLLNILEKHGKNSVGHIPDALISYSGTFPTDTDACLLALYQHLAKTIPGSEILAATEKSWRIRYPLSRTPRVSIAVLSSNQPDLLRRCLESITQKTGYPDLEILLQLSPEEKSDRFLAEWIAQQQAGNRFRLSVVDRSAADDLSAQCNRAVRLFPGEFVALLRDDAVIIQPEWLEELVRTALQNDIAMAAPRLIRAGDAHIRSVGQVLGLRGALASPYANEATLKDNGYLDYLQIARDVSSVSNACALFRKTAFVAVDGIDESLPDADLAWADFCLKLLAAGHRLLCQPLATVVDGDTPPLDIEADFAAHNHRKLAKAQGEQLFNQRWLAAFPADPFWNPNLSLHSKQIVPETDYLPQWRYFPVDAYRIFARPITGAQATYRITSPLQALVNTGRVAQCVWPMGSSPRDELSMAEMARLSADTVIVQNYIYDHHLAALENWRKLSNRPFTVYALDDLIIQMGENNPFRKLFPGNSTSRLKFALERCDRLVVSTNFLANVCTGFSKDIRVVPNRLESELWLPLVSNKRTGKKPRIGWAGGSTHLGDLLLLKEVIERTRHEADWVFFGMCPDEIRPLIAEFHGLKQLAAYPAKLASLNLDIAVAPLEQTSFNQAKSNLRLLEYGALGIPVVCTDINPYRNSPAHCVANTTDAWVNALRERINDSDAREREGVILRQWVRQHYLLESHLDEWLAAHQPEQS